MGEAILTEILMVLSVDP